MTAIARKQPPNRSNSDPKTSRALWWAAGWLLLHLWTSSAAVAANEPKIVVSPLIHGGVFADL